VPISTTRSLGARLTTSVVAALAGAGAGFALGLVAAAIVASLLEPHVSTDGEGWGIIIVWIAGAFGGTAIGGVIGLILGYRRRPVPATPPRPDRHTEDERTAS
jgi:hypothetical protein